MPLCLVPLGWRSQARHSQAPPGSCRCAARWLLSVPKYLRWKRPSLAGLGLGAPPGGAAEDLAERLVRVGARLAGQAEDPLADDVALDLVAAAGDRHDPAVEEVQRRRLAWLAVGPGDAPPARDLPC